MSFNICRGTLLAMFAAIRRVSLFRLPTDMLTVTPHAIFKPVHPGRSVLQDARLCEVVNNFGRHSEASGQGVSRDCREQRFGLQLTLSIDHRHPLQSHTAHVHTGAVVGFNKRKMEDARRHEAEKVAAARRATDRQILEDAEQLVTAWNERQAKRMPMLFSPTIGAAIKAGYWFLRARCPACRTTGDVDLRTLDWQRCRRDSAYPHAVVPILPAATS